MLPVVLNVLWRVWEDVCAQEGVGGCFLGGYCMDWRLGLVRCMAYRWPGWDWPCLGLIPIDGLVGMTVFSFVQGGMISLMRRLFFFFFNKDGMEWEWEWTNSSLALECRFYYFDSCTLKS